MPKTKKAPDVEAVQISTKTETIIPRRRWAVVRHDWRTGKKERVAIFLSPSYAGIFKRAMGELSDVRFEIKEVIR